MTDESLKPCPWCGVKAEYYRDDNGLYARCGTNSCVMFYRLFRINDWNKRHEPEKKSGDKKTVTMYQPVIHGEESIFQGIYEDHQREFETHREEDIKGWIKHEVELV